MKRIVCSMLIVVLSVAATFGQPKPPIPGAAGSSGNIPLGIGATFIDGKAYYLVNLMPELAFGDLGFGLDLNLRIGSDGKIRKEDFDEGQDYLRMIRYIRWAQKGDDFYIRVGQLDNARLGHGFVVYNYRNSPSYDMRRVGMELDLNFDKFGFESLYSDFAYAGVLGMRGYVKPLKFTSLAKLPVLNNIEAGVTYAVDISKNANKEFVAGSPPTVTDNGSMSILGMDVGVPIISYPIIKSTVYFDYATITNFGAGAAAGIDLHFSGLGLVTLSAKYERRFTGDQFIPSYFDALYEHDRFIPLDSVAFTSKAMALKNAKGGEGYYGEVVISALGTLNIVGGYQSPVGVRNQGILHMELLTGDIIPILQLSAGYDKRNVGAVFRVDNNSVLHAEVGYKPYPFMIVSTLYQWTFQEQRDDQGRVTGYKPQRRIEPKVSFVFSF